MHHDIIVIGGGIAGSTVGLAASRAGLRVLVLESELAFRDRIRGEGLHAWGVREARRLAIADLLHATCARSLPYWDTYVGGKRVDRRDLRHTSVPACESMSFHHPNMQEALLKAAENAGASVRRGAKVGAIKAGSSPSVTFEGEGGNEEHASGRLVVVATGRSSALFSMLGLTTVRGESGSKTTGVLLDEVDIADDAVSMFFPPTFGMAVPVFPLPHRRARIYFAAHPRLDSPSFSGPSSLPGFVDQCRRMGVLHPWLEHAKLAGPLATFDGTPIFLRGAWPAGVALVGDAAGSLDPAFGAGLSLALLDARTLTERLTTTDDVSQASRWYEAERAVYYARLLRLESCVGRVLYGLGTADGAPRPALLPRLRELGLDLVGGGPFCPIDEDAERALFGDP
jgi:menaquinone-9 beta-reductase